jgi:hypothetical protein
VVSLTAACTDAEFSAGAEVDERYGILTFARTSFLLRAEAPSPVMRCGRPSIGALSGVKPVVEVSAC